MQWHAETAGVFHATQVQDLRAAGGHFQHFFAGDRFDLLGRGNHARVGGVNAVHVGVDFADIGAQCCGQCDGGGVRAATAHGGDVFGFLAHALETSDDGDESAVDGTAYALWGDL